MRGQSDGGNGDVGQPGFLIGHLHGRLHVGHRRGYRHGRKNRLGLRLVHIPVDDRGHGDIEVERDRLGYIGLDQRLRAFGRLHNLLQGALHLRMAAGQRLRPAGLLAGGFDLMSDGALHLGFEVLQIEMAHDIMLGDPGMLDLGPVEQAEEQQPDDDPMH